LQQRQINQISHLTTHATAVPRMTKKQHK